MSSIPRRVLNNLQRPLPDLLSYLCAKMVSLLWRSALKHTGRGFHVGSGTIIQGGQHVSIGDGFVARQLLWIEAVREYAGVRYDPIIEIGHGVTCSQSVHIGANTRVTIRDGVMLGSRVHITDHSHGRYHGDAQDSPETRPTYRPLAPGRPVLIERNVWLGDGVVVLPGVTIGEGTIVGANSVVSRDLPARVIAVGAPAVPIKTYDPASGRWHPVAERS